MLLNDKDNISVLLPNSMEKTVRQRSIVLFSLLNIINDPSHCCNNETH